MHLGELVRAHGDALLRAARYLGAHEHDLEDVVQDVFLVALRRIDEVPADQRQAWLFGVLRKRVSESRRRAFRHREVLGMELERTRSQPDEGVLERRALLAALGRLDDDKREVVVFHDIEEMTMREISEVLSVPLQTAYSRLYAGRDALAKALGTPERTMA